MAITSSEIYVREAQHLFHRASAVAIVGVHMHIRHALAAGSA